MLKTIVLKGIALAMLLGCITPLQSQVDGLHFSADTSFRLSRGVHFQGRVARSSAGSQMHLVGDFSLQMAHPFFAEKRFPIDAWIHPDSIILPFAGETWSLVTGIYYSPTRRLLYNRWLERPLDDADIPLRLAMGGMAYDIFEATFVIGPMAKLQGRDYRGATASVDSAQAVVTSSSKISLPMQPVKHKWSMDLAGEWREDRRRNEYLGHFAARISLTKLPSKAWEKLADKVQVVTAINPSIEWSDRRLLQAIAEFKDPNPRKDPKHMDAFLAHLPTVGSRYETGACEHIQADLLLSGIQFRQDVEMHTLWSASEVGLVGIGGSEICSMSTSNTKIEYSFGAAGATDTLRLYLEFDEMNWAFFEQYGETLHAYSSDIDGFNAVVAPRDQAFTANGEVAKEAFLARFVNTYIWRTGRPWP